MDIMNRLQKNIGTGTCKGVGTSTGDQDVNYCLMEGGLVRL